VIGEELPEPGIGQQPLPSAKSISRLMLSRRVPTVITVPLSPVWRPGRARTIAARELSRPHP